MPRLAVITGDLINSTGVSDPQAYRQYLRELMDAIARDFDALTSVYRGDGFQVAIDASKHNAFEIGLLIRVALISHGNKAERWDARVAIAFGTGQSVSDQDSGAYQASGQALDAMTESKFVVHGRNRFESLALCAATCFVDAIIDKLTIVEAEVLFLYLRYRESHQNIAFRLNKKRPTVTLALQRAHYYLLDRYIRDMNELVRMTYESTG